MNGFSIFLKVTLPRVALRVSGEWLGGSKRRKKTFWGGPGLATEYPGSVGNRRPPPALTQRGG